LLGIAKGKTANYLISFLESHHNNQKATVYYPTPKSDRPTLISPKLKKKSLDRGASFIKEPKKLDLAIFLDVVISIKRLISQMIQELSVNIL